MGPTQVRLLVAEARNRQGRPPKYPWDDWFDLLGRGTNLRLEAGVDFDIPVETMRRSFLTEARRRGVDVTSCLQERRRILRFDPAPRRRSYPWEEWLAGQMQPLTPSVDFDVHLEVMREMARRAAKQRGLGFRSRWYNGQLWVQGLHDTNALQST